MGTVNIKKLKDGDLFKLKKGDKTIYVKDRYGKRIKRFVCYEHNNISEILSLKKNTKIYPL